MPFFAYSFSVGKYEHIPKFTIEVMSQEFPGIGTTPYVFVTPAADDHSTEFYGRPKCTDSKMLHPHWTKKAQRAPVFILRPRRLVAHVPQKTPVVQGNKSTSDPPSHYHLPSGLLESVPGDSGKPTSPLKTASSMDSEKKRKVTKMMPEPEVSHGSKDRAIKVARKGQKLALSFLPVAKEDLLKKYRSTI